MHHGGRHGTWQNGELGQLDFHIFILTNTASMHRIDVDATQAVFRGWKDYHSEMRDCMSVKFGW